MKIRLNYQLKPVSKKKPYQINKHLKTQKIEFQAVYRHWFQPNYHQAKARGNKTSQISSLCKNPHLKEWTRTPKRTRLHNSWL